MKKLVVMLGALSLLATAAQADESTTVRTVRTLITTTAGQAVTLVHDEALNIGDLAEGTIEEIVEGGQCVVETIGDMHLHETPVCLVSTGTGVAALVVSEATDASGSILVFAQKITSEAILKNFEKLMMDVGETLGPVGVPFVIVAKIANLTEKVVTFLLLNGVYGRLVIVKDGVVTIVEETAEMADHLFHLKLMDALRDLRTIIATPFRTAFRMITSWKKPQHNSALLEEMEALNQKFSEMN